MNRDRRRRKESSSTRYDADAPSSTSGVPGREQEDQQPVASQESMTLAELIDAADVTVRTVRYYIAEGLLPPPIGAGPASAYGRGHLDRLRLIQRLKEAYLPLKEIRRRLSGLGDDEVRAILAAGEDTTMATSLRETPADAALAEARDYLAMMESRQRYRTEPMALVMPQAPVEEHESAAEGGDFMPEESLAGRQLATPAQSARQDRSYSSPAPDRGAAGHDVDLWRRIPLGDEAELVISDRVYARHRDRIDWLVRWARKVFA